MPTRDLNNSQDQNTKNRILYEATRLFAMNSFDAVSIRDIGEAVGIKSSSIYKHYANKDAVLEAILEKFETEYLDYFKWLAVKNQAADSLEKMLENMFTELLEIHDMFTYYSMALVLKEQFNKESACKRVIKLFYVDSIRFIQQDFDRLVENKIIPPCDTKMIATIFMHSVLIGSEMRIHENLNHDLPASVTEMYSNLKWLITSMLRKGV